LCLTDIQIIIVINNSIEGLGDGILTFLGHGASIISVLKGVEKQGKCPLSDKPPIQSMGGGGELTLINEGIT